MIFQVHRSLSHFCSLLYMEKNICLYNFFLKIESCRKKLKILLTVQTPSYFGNWLPMQGFSHHQDTHNCSWLSTCNNLQIINNNKCLLAECTVLLATEIKVFGTVQKNLWGTHSCPGLHCIQIKEDRQQQQLCKLKVSSGFWFLNLLYSEAALLNTWLT